MSQREGAEEVPKGERVQDATGNADAPEGATHPVPPHGRPASSSTQYVDPAHFYGHQYYHGAVPPTHPSVGPAGDSDYALFMSEFAAGGVAGGAAAYEARRANRQLGHYLPPTQVPASAPAAAGTATKKPTRDELRLFRRRREERKRIRNKWLFE